MRTLKSLSSTKSTVVVPESTATGTTTTATTITTSPPAMQRSPWHSPVPYLFGGLAAMLGLIAFALLILACSYWKLSGQMNGNGEEDEDDDLESGDGKKGPGKGTRMVVYQEQFVVILAGDDKPTCLAMPVTSRANSFNDNISETGVEKKGLVSEKADKSTSQEQQNVVVVEEPNESQLHQLHLEQEQPETSS